jgi:long-chain acyl-CoA synthetase
VPTDDSAMSFGTFAVADSDAVQAIRNVADLVRRNAVATPDRPALIWQDQTTTWRALDALVDKYARGLIALGLPADAGGHPARVAMSVPNRPEFAAVYFAVLRAGLIAVPVNPGYTARELGQILRDSGTTVLIGTPDVVAAAADVALSYAYHVGSQTTDGARPLAELAHDGDPVESSTGGDDLAVLLYTSGTEGSPKGAMLPHRALLANHRQLDAIEPAPVGSDDVLLLAIPMFHAYGLNAGLGAVAFHGAAGVLVDTFEPAETLRLIEAHHVTAVVGVPTMFVAWSLLSEFGEAFASVRVAVCGAAPLPITAAQQFAEATSHPVFIGYGLTEAAPVVATTLASPTPKTGSIGRALPGVEVRLVAPSGEDVWNTFDEWDADDFDDDASGSPGTDPGEIVVRGDNLFVGYWPDRRGGPDSDGWWHTGDVAYADADGDLFLVDRVRELILVNGFNVYPAEVEKVLTAHAAVAEAAVLGIPHPYSGQSVKAYVVATEPIGQDELVRHCERNLARFKCPSAFEFVTSLPHSAIGKVRKGELRYAGE